MLFMIISSSVNSVTSVNNIGTPGIASYDYRLLFGSCFESIAITINSSFAITGTIVSAIFTFQSALTRALLLQLLSLLLIFSLSLLLFLVLVLYYYNYDCYYFYFTY